MLRISAGHPGTDWALPVGKADNRLRLLRRGEPTG